ATLPRGKSFDTATPLRLRTVLRAFVGQYLQSKGLSPEEVDQVAYHDFSKPAEDAFYKAQNINPSVAEKWWNRNAPGIISVPPEPDLATRVKASQAMYGEAAPAAAPKYADQNNPGIAQNLNDNAGVPQKAPRAKKTKAAPEEVAPGFKLTKESAGYAISGDDGAVYALHATKEGALAEFKESYPQYASKAAPEPVKPAEP